MQKKLSVLLLVFSLTGVATPVYAAAGETQAHKCGEVTITEMNLTSVAVVTAITLF